MHDPSRQPDTRSVEEEAYEPFLARPSRLPAPDPDPYARTASGRIRAESGRLGAGSGRFQPPRWVPNEHVHEFTDTNFREEVLEADLPVLVDFWADTCVPCRRQEPTIERFAVEMQGRLKVGRLNVYESPHTAELFHVKGVPHLMVVHQGEVVLELVGDHSLEQLRSYVSRLELDD